MNADQNKILAGKTALVTGGSRGIGAAIAKRLAAAGAKVAISYSSSAQAADKVVAEIKAHGGEAAAFKADAASVAAVDALVETVVSRFGPIDILVNNAGIFEGKPIGETTDEDYERSFAVNVRGVFAATRAATRAMPDGGRVINIGSVLGQRVPLPGLAIYAGTKFAVQGLTRGWARELAPRKITVNVIQPGPIDTDMNPETSDFSQVLSPMTALGRYGKAQEVAEAALFLASPAASYVTGEALNVDGGMEA